MSRLIPSKNKLDDIDPPLTDDECELAYFFDEYLPEGWEIYVRPYMNAEWPSVAILNPEVGLTIYDLLYWEEGEFRRVKKKFPRYDGGGFFTLRHFMPVDGGQKRNDPVRRAQRYRDNLIGIYLPQIGEAVDEKPRYEDHVTVGLYCPNMTTKEARGLLGGLGNWCAVFGKNHLKPEALENLIVPPLRREGELDVAEWADKVRFLFNPPFHTKDRGRRINLTSKQEKYAQPNPGKHRRLKGVAGSGKTLVLAQRAARNAAEGASVLVVYYNITLGHYIRHYIDQARESFDWTNIEIVHFHGFCQRFLSENNIPWPTADGEDILTKVVPERVIEAKRDGHNIMNRSYDVILIDEGQDFDDLWFEALNEFLEQPGEVLLVADERQNIYNRIHSFGGMRFSGPWGSLESSYRMPSNLIREVNRFADLYIDDSESEYAGGLVKEAAAQTEFSFAQPTLVWKDVSGLPEAKDQLLEALRYLTTEENVHPQDIVILLPNHENGMFVAKSLKEKGFEANHVFGKESNDSISRRNKKSFFMDDGRLKLSTIHSFKGWELINVLLITPTEGDSLPPGTDLNLLLYTAITRARENLFVFNQHSKYNHYGSTWQSSWE